MYINIKQETAANYPQSPKLWCIRPLELVFSTNSLTSQGLVSPSLKWGFQSLSNLRRILDRIITNGRSTEDLTKDSVKNHNDFLALQGLLFQ